MTTAMITTSIKTTDAMKIAADRFDIRFTTHTPTHDPRICAGSGNQA